MQEITLTTIALQSVVISHHSVTLLRFSPPHAAWTTSARASIQPDSRRSHVLVPIPAFLQALTEEPTGRISLSQDKISHTKGERSLWAKWQQQRSWVIFFHTLAWNETQRQVTQFPYRATMGKKKNVIKSVIIFFKNKKGTTLESPERSGFFFSSSFTSFFFQFRAWKSRWTPSSECVSAYRLWKWISSLWIIKCRSALAEVSGCGASVNSICVDQRCLDAPCEATSTSRYPAAHLWPSGKSDSLRAFNFQTHIDFQASQRSPCKTWATRTATAGTFRGSA